MNLPKGQVCVNCAFAEWESNRRRRTTRYYCTNCHSDKCFQWVEQTDTCEHWLQYNAVTRFYNAV